MNNKFDRFLAHSATISLPEQSYLEHIEGTCRLAEENVSTMAAYAPSGLSEAIKNAVLLAACFHDLGKLADENQNVLHGIIKAAHLPICHRDAGAAYLYGLNQVEAALLVKAHHAPGLPSLSEEHVSNFPLRSRNEDVRQNTNMYLNEYISLHHKEVSFFPENNAELNLSDGLSRRLALSCLVDADHSDSAHFQKTHFEPRWEERLAKLDAFVDKTYQKSQRISRIDVRKRNELRNSIYKACRNANIESSIVYCDSPVGSGKTTAIMAYLLKTALAKKLRHIIVVLPFTSIITQSVETYREALTLDGENPEYIIAEHDHQADFSSLTARRLASLWHAPIVVTTAVQFFETLGSNSPSRLRKLHELPGSGIFIDECHAAIPAWLWPQAWNWLKLLTSYWGCHVVFSSGTASKFWDIPNFLEVQESVPSLLPEKLSKELESHEQRRVTFKIGLNSNEIIPAFRDIEALIEFIRSKQGPRLVIMNTVLGAAYLAQSMKNKNLNVLHLSTALTPKDRKRVVKKIRIKLGNSQYSDWTLVATSCVEAGMNFSFRNGFSQIRSVTSFLQASGRVCRESEYKDSEMYCFSLRVSEIPNNSEFKTSQKIFLKMIQQNLFHCMNQTELITECMRRELQEDYNSKTEKLLKYERIGNFPKVAETCVVIENDTIMVVMNAQVIEELEKEQYVSSINLIQNSVRIRREIAMKFKLNTVKGHEDLFKWVDNGYDPNFLGYMKALL